MNQERDELIKTMVRTFLEKSERQAYSDHRIDLDAMAAVLDVCVDELLPRITDQMRPEWDECWQEDDHKYGHTQWQNLQDRGYRTMILVENRRHARYAPPKPKTQEEEALRENLYAILAGTGSDAELYVRHIMELIADLNQKEQR